MITKKIEVSIMLEASTLAKLQRASRASGCNEEVIIEHAIARFFGETVSPNEDCFGALKQRDDWEHLVEDWFVGQVHDAAD